MEGRLQTEGSPRGRDLDSIFYLRPCGVGVERSVASPVQEGHGCPAPLFFVFQSNPHGCQNLAQANDWRVPEKSLQQLMFVLTCLYFCSVLIYWTTDQPYSELSRFLLSKRQTNITTLLEAPTCESVVTTPAPPTIYIITTNTTTTNKSSTNNDNKQHTQTSTTNPPPQSSNTVSSTPIDYPFFPALRSPAWSAASPGSQDSSSSSSCISTAGPRPFLR